ncbi:hypothetical protein H8B02_05275 [Bradyrhizobium sp. Pear77]|uniref:hypothetical protein n=1 Tax=Bradyrhizobium altum TaxID=1571202 RepID=UPI001E6269C6|nr:hypothetical protein [Bradyrhizobium altum]MCC8952895.1 hypothetical protein [Bradyrhizobium altum]
MVLLGIDDDSFFAKALSVAVLLVQHAVEATRAVTAATKLSRPMAQLFPKQTAFRRPGADLGRL